MYTVSNHVEKVNFQALNLENNCVPFSEEYSFCFSAF